MADSPGILTWLQQLVLAVNNIGNQFKAAVTGPATSTSGNVASFADATGKVLADSGFSNTNFSGIWNNSRTSITANNTVSISLNGGTLALNSAYFTLTFGTASGYPSKFVVAVVNEDANAGKLIKLTGRTNLPLGSLLDSFMLWPGQSCLIFNDNNSWQIIGAPRRWQLTSATTFYVDNVLGAAVTDGLAAGARAFSTVQGAYNNLVEFLDFNVQSVTVQLTQNQTITESVVISSTFLGNHNFTLQGDSAGTSPNLYPWTIAGGSGTYCIFATDYGVVSLKGIQFGSTAGSSNLLQASQFAVIDVRGCGFASNVGGIDCLVIGDGLAKMNITGDTSTSPNFIRGNCSVFCQANGSGLINIAAPLSFDTVANVNIGILLKASNGGRIYTNGSPISFSGANLGSAGGQRFAGDTNGSLSLSGTSFPATFAVGTLDSGAHTDHFASFQAYLATSSAAGVTGDGTQVVMPLDTSVFDKGSDFSVTTAAFTAPYSATFRFSASVALTGIQSTNTFMIISYDINGVLTTAWQGNPFAIYDATDGVLDISISEIFNMTGGQTLQILVTVSGGTTKTVKFVGNTARATRLSGQLSV